LNLQKNKDSATFFGKENFLQNGGYTGNLQDFFCFR
jgi:hypothetical protein